MESAHSFSMGYACFYENGGGIVIRDQSNTSFQAWLGGKTGEIRDNFEQAKNDLIELKRG